MDASPIRPIELKPGQLCQRCPLESLNFETTSQVPDLSDGLGQARAAEAIRFGIGIQQEGYNLYAMGPAGTGKRSVVRRYLDEKAAAEGVPPDWCYVHNFAQDHRPRALSLPAGRAARFSSDMARLVEDLRAGIPAAFETEEYNNRVHQLTGEFNERQEAAFEEFRARAKGKNVGLLRTPGGFALAPLHKGEVIEPAVFQKLPKEERQRKEAAIAGLQDELEKVVQELPRWRRETQRKIRELNRAATRSVVFSLIEELRREYAGLEPVQGYLTQVQEDVIENADDFRKPKEGEQPTLFGIPLPQPEAAEISLRRYRVNVLIDHAGTLGAPVVYEDNPTHDNLVGRIEHLAHMGTLVTDFTQIKPGALHAANGGYLILDAHKVLAEPFSWEALKRVIRSHEIAIEPVARMLGIAGAVSLEPEPVPLQVKVVLVGERLLYYLLHEYDPDFAELFKVAADFDEDMGRTPENVGLYARLVATLTRKEGLRPLDRPAVARIVEHSSRQAGDAGKLSAQKRGLADLLREADYWAGLETKRVVTAADVQRAIDAQERRSDRLRERLREEVLRGTVLIDTRGERPGAVNGLSVLQLGAHAFGQATRITARVRLGSGKVVDIEREVELGGPIHSKGVLILSGFIAGRYVPDRPLSLSASLVFEQSYGGVEGDSASCAELYALLSALAEAPIRQSLAVTGSVNQQGEVQAIGGANEKIEGFFDLCRERGLTGDQGVLIPASNVRHLMLRSDVVEAVAAGRFHVYPVQTVDQGIEILTGVPAGERRADGAFPPGTLNARVEARLVAFAEGARAFSSPRLAQPGEKEAAP